MSLRNLVLHLPTQKPIQDNERKHRKNNLTILIGGRIWKKFLWCFWLQKTFWLIFWLPFFATMISVVSLACLFMLLNLGIAFRTGNRNLIKYSWNKHNLFVRIDSASFRALSSKTGVSNTPYSSSYRRTGNRIHVSSSFLFPFYKDDVSRCFDS